MTLKLVTGLATLIGFVSAVFPDCGKGPLSNNTVCNTKAAPYARASALVGLFTLEEKINNTQNKSPGVPRIGLPAYEWWSEALHGVARSPGVHFASSGNFSYATSFPQPITMGAAFDDDLILSVATVTSTEARAFSNGYDAGLNYWTPNINPYKDPRWGRGQETPGEDAFHLSSYVDQLIIGLQGGRDAQPFKKIVATCKHYAGYDLEDWQGNYRYGFNAIITDQDLREYYLPPFQQCARDSNVQSIMCSYNAVNGVPACSDTYLLQTILREHWKWTDEDQWITSDCDAVKNVWEDHDYGADEEEAAASSLNAGTDLDCGTYYPEHLGLAYSQGLFNLSTLDRSLIRRYASLVRLGYFDPADTQPYRQLTFADVSTIAAQSLALRAAEEGIVLLKNDGILPFDASNKSVAIIGPWAQASTEMQGNYYGIAPYLHTVYGAAQKSGWSVTYSLGTNLSSSDNDGFEEALAAARKSEIIIYVGGVDNSIENEEKDRNEISWPGNQLDLINQLSNLNKKFIVVQMGTQVDSSSLVSNAAVNALVWAGYPGQDGGTAVVNILKGKVAPAGRLPVTQYPASYVNDIPMTNMDLRPSSSSPGRTYKWYTGKPVFEFGHGLHYTNFSAKLESPASTTYTISSLVPRDIEANAQQPWKDLIPFATVPVTVTNTGKVSSDFVVLGYLTGTFGPTPYPKKSLTAYKRLHGISAGQSQTAQLKLTLGSLARADESGDLYLYPGQYSLVIDNDAKALWNFTLVGEKLLLDAWPKRLQTDIPSIK
ncbi:hypothetical protein G7Y89_g1445 [Cudoniella acicularis]|uniref:xylan 1,4-beta-xylosidase n=1 Tax=Cudoniella acicularis TaxID=354080 RepID=A0A8H4RY61_9HELO|nr:hypothetical protein G7Y89_g1445 [Cudoniella acicularis]